MQEGYQFDKPIIISMLYSVKAILDGTAAPTDWEPMLTIYDVDTKTWIPAKNTCPPETRWDEINHAERRYSVAVCHLTQFAVFYQKRVRVVCAAAAIVYIVVDGVVYACVVRAQPVIVHGHYAVGNERVWTNSSAVLQRLVAGDADASAGVETVLVQLVRDAATGTLAAVDFGFDASDSYDPDGTVDVWTWTTVGVSGANTTAAFATQHGETNTLSISEPGIVRATLEITDNTDGRRTKDFWFWADEPPIAALGAGLPSQPAPKPNNVWPSKLVHAAVEDVSFAVVVDGTASWDPEASPLLASWSLVDGQLASRYGASTVTLAPAIAAPASNHLTGVVTGLRAGTRHRVALDVTTDDDSGASGSAVMDVIVNALPRLQVMAPEVVFLPGGTNVTLSIAGSDDLDGTVVRRTWTLVAVRPSDIFDRVTASSLGTGSTETVTISNVTERCEFVYTVELEDNDGGVINSGPRSVVFKYLSAAVAVANTDVSQVVSPPRWATMARLQFNGSQSFDLDGDIKSYAWTVSSAVVHGENDEMAAMTANVALGSANTAFGYMWRGYTAGDFIVTLTVIDSDNVQLRDSVAVRVLGVLDVASATDRGYISLLLPATNTTLSAAPHVHPEAAVTKYVWSVVSSTVVGGASCSPVLSVTTSGPAPASGPAPSADTMISGLCGAGTYVVGLSMDLVDTVDSSAHTVASTVTVVVHEPPTARVNSTMRTAASSTSLATVVGRVETVSALDSIDDRVELTYAWTAAPALVTFDDATAASTKMRAVSAGRTTVTLTVWDDAMEPHTTTHEVWVMATPLTAVLDVAEHLVVARAPALGGTTVGLSAARSTFADGVVSDYEWTIDSATTDPHVLGAAATAAFLPSASTAGGRGPSMTLVNPTGPFDYHVRVQVTAPDATTAWVKQRVRVLGFVDETESFLPLAMPATQAALSVPNVRRNSFAQPATHAWRLMRFYPLPATGGVSTVAESCTGGVTPDATTAATVAWPRVVLECGPGDYVVETDVAVKATYSQPGATPYPTYTTTVSRTVHLHRPPVPSITLDVATIDAGLFVAPSPATASTASVDLWVLTWLSNTVPLRVTSAGSTDDDGAVVVAWNVSAAVAGVPSVIDADSPAQGAVSSDGASFMTVEQPRQASTAVTVHKEGRVWLTATITDKYGASTNATVQVLVFKTRAEAEEYRNPDESWPWWQIALVVLAGLVVVGVVAAVLWVKCRKKDDTPRKSASNVIHPKPMDLTVDPAPTAAAPPSQAEVEAAAQHQAMMLAEAQQMAGMGGNGGVAPVVPLTVSPLDQVRKFSDAAPPSDDEAGAGNTAAAASSGRVAADAQSLSALHVAVQPSPHSAAPTTSADPVMDLINEAGAATQGSGAAAGDDDLVSGLISEANAAVQGSDAAAHDDLVSGLISEAAAADVVANGSKDDGEGLRTARSAITDSSGEDVAGLGAIAAAPALHMPAPTTLNTPVNSTTWAGNSRRAVLPAVSRHKK